MSETKETKVVRECCVCQSNTANEHELLCNDCKRAVLIFRTIISVMEKDGLCFLAGFGDVEKEVKSVNV